MIDIGYFSLCVALAFSGWAMVAPLVGVRRGNESLIRSGERAFLAVCALITVAVIALWNALLSHDFQVQYVAETSNRAMPLIYVIAALWGGQEGSLLFWNWILTIYGAALVLINAKRYRRLMPFAVPVVAATVFFFTLIHLFEANPFVRLPFTPADGRGLNPLLQHPVMAIHPPTLYLGMVGMAVPFAIAVAALWSGQLDQTWLLAVRRWMLVPWTFLGAGLLLGGKWAYVELGWGGYWAWDPVENASFMPWLSATAFLHSAMIQERRGMLKMWNLILVILTYALCIFGTFITRSGIIDSVHAFARSNIGPFFSVFLILILVFSISLLWHRYRELRAENRLESLASRETAFLLNNWVLLGMLFAVFWGTIFPLLSETFTAEKISVTAPFFNQVNIPIGLVLIFLTGAGPLFAWRRTSAESLKRNFTWPGVAALVTAALLVAAGIADLYAVMSLALCAFVLASLFTEFHRGTQARQRTTQVGYLRALYALLAKSRRRYGGYLVHLAMILLFVGFTGKAFTVEREVELGVGESVQIDDYTLRYEALAQSEDANKTAVAAALSLFLDDRFVTTLMPARHEYKSFEQGTTEVSIFSRLREDFYIILVGWNELQSAKFLVYINPLVNAVWVGGIVFVLGSLWAMWPTARDRRLAQVDRRAMQAVGSGATTLRP